MLLKVIRCIFNFQYLVILVLPLILLKSSILFSFFLLMCILFLFFVLKKPYFLLVSFPLFVLNFIQLIYYYLIEKQIIGISIFDFVFNVNPEELATISKNYFYLFILLFLYVSFTFYFFKSFEVLKLKTGKWISIVLLGLMMLFGTLSFMNDGYESNYISVICNRYYKAKLNNEKRLNYETAIESFSFGFPENKIDSSIIVIVIGESSRAQNYSLYGYNRDTNPLLDSQDNLYKFKVYTPFILTALSVPYALNRIPYEHYMNKLYTEKSIISALHEVGYRTYYLNNSCPDKSLIHFYKEKSDISYSPDTLMSLDGELLPYFNKVIGDSAGKKCIIIHLYGSHFIYNKRYPHEFSVYKPDYYNRIVYSNKEEILNSYDNSILYTDYVINSLITRLKGIDVPSTLIYFSDHGENLFDTDEKLEFHVNFNKFTYKIPFIVWFSNSFIHHRNIVETVEANSNKLTDTKCLFHTVLDIAGLDSSFFNTSKSLLNRNFVTSDSVRYFDNNNEPVAIPYED